MNLMDYATNPLRSNKRPLDQLFREVFVPTPEEVAVWRAKKEAADKVRNAAIAKLKREGKW